MGRDHLILDNGDRFFAGGDRTLKVILNGFVVSDIGSHPIRSGDRLLISYGPESPEQVLATQFTLVPANAEEYNVRDDPAGCSGAVDIGLRERPGTAFWTCST